MKKNLLFLIAIFFLQASAAFSATSSWHENQSKGAKTRLIASFYEDQKGEQKLIAGIKFKIANGWKIYGNGAGESGIGLAPELELSASKNYKKHEIIWPQAKVGEEDLGSEKIKYFYYDDEIILPVEISITDKNQPVNLSAKLLYGLCKDICIVANEEFSLDLSQEADKEVLEQIQKFYPQKISDNSTSQKQNEISQNKISRSLISAILLAIFGGTILNIMPCVLPVLSIKLLSIINHSNTKISKIRFAFLSTIFGILSCFVVFASITAIIKSSGDALSWGLQFQNPYFLIFLSLVLTLLTGNLLGIFEVNFSNFLATILNKKISEGEKRYSIFAPNFFSGILAVLLATPCSAPFLGSAISFALTQEISIIFIIFLAIGFGLSLPYFLLLIAPKLVYFLPKPGNWMIKVKQILAGFLAATIIWLIYVLSHNIGFTPALAVAILSILILACIKIRSNLLKIILFITLTIAAFLVPMKIQEQQKMSSQTYNSMWIEFDETKIAELVAENKVVIVDVTADWCLTCKFNKVRVFHSDEVMEKLKDPNIVAMRGDITKPNETIIMFLRQHNRFAIPFNAVYGPHAKNGLLTNELLTKKELFELIEKAK